MLEAVAIGDACHVFTSRASFCNAFALHRFTLSLRLFVPAAVIHVWPTNLAGL